MHYRGTSTFLFIFFLCIWRICKRNHIRKEIWVTFSLRENVLNFDYIKKLNKINPITLLNYFLRVATCLHELSIQLLLFNVCIPWIEYTYFSPKCTFFRISSFFIFKNIHINVTNSLSLSIKMTNWLASNKPWGQIKVLVVAGARVSLQSLTWRSDTETPLDHFFLHLIQFPLHLRFLCWFQFHFPVVSKSKQQPASLFHHSWVDVELTNEVKADKTRKMSVSLTVMTFNLLEDQPEDGPNSWDKRKDLCVTVITSYSPMIICTQQGM